MRLVLPIFLLFLSCMGEEGYKLGSTGIVQKSPASDCDSPSFSALQAESPTPEVCSAISNYYCDVIIYSPEVKTAEESDTECVKDNECVEVTKMTFDTSGALDSGDADPKELEKGGQLNFTKYTCLVKDFRDDKGKFRFVGTSDSLKEAVEKSQAECLKGAL